MRSVKVEEGGRLEKTRWQLDGTYNLQVGSTFIVPPACTCLPLCLPGLPLYLPLPPLANKKGLAVAISAMV